MKRTEFERVTPESVGISSRAVLRFAQRFDSCEFTEPHSMMIMRHGKICAEGWWAPYAPGMRHNLMSETKSYAGTALGIAVTEGLVGLNDRIIDIFPEHCPQNPSEGLQKMRVRDVLCMGSGIGRVPNQTENWIGEYLALPLSYEPGTTFHYSGMCDIVGAIVRKVSGETLFDFLKTRLFDKIGIDSRRMPWLISGDGAYFCSAGLQATTEDNLRLLKLYLDGGVWEGERILSEEYVKLATTEQIDNSYFNLKTFRSEPERVAPKGSNDDTSGYGFLFWMCKRPGAYRADGLAGQYVVVVPDLDLLISVTQNCEDLEAMRDTIWELVDSVTGDAALPEDAAAFCQLTHTLKRLALPAEPFAPHSPKAEQICGTKWKMASGFFTPGQFFFGPPQGSGVTEFSLRFTEDAVTMDYLSDGKPYRAIFALDGSRRYNEIGSLRVLLSAYWVNGKTLRMSWRSCAGLFNYAYDYEFGAGRCDIRSAGKVVATPNAAAPTPIYAYLTE